MWLFLKNIFKILKECKVEEKRINIGESIISPIKFIYLILTNCKIQER